MNLTSMNYSQGAVGRSLCSPDKLNGMEDVGILL